MYMYMLDYYELGRKIREKRIEFGYTQEKLAELCDISTGFLGHIEKGTRKLSLDTLFCIANTLHVSLDYLLLDATIQQDEIGTQINAAVRNAPLSSSLTFKKVLKILVEHIDEL